MSYKRVADVPPVCISGPVIAGAGFDKVLTFVVTTINIGRQRSSVIQNFRIGTLGPFENARFFTRENTSAAPFLAWMTGGQHHAPQRANTHLTAGIRSVEDHTAPCGCAEMNCMNA